MEMCPSFLLVIGGAHHILSMFLPDEKKGERRDQMPWKQRINSLLYTKVKPNSKSNKVSYLLMHSLPYLLQLLST
jgi:hypothetical protein